jgi:hypothetical protein
MLADRQYQTASSLPHAAGSIEVGCVSIDLSSLVNDGLSLDAGLQQFCASCGEPDINIELDWAPRIQAQTQTPDFNSGAVWSVYSDPEGYTFDFLSEAISDAPYKRLRVDPSFRKGRITLSREALTPYLPVSPLEYPADELLITNYLAHHGLGVEVHGCGMVDSEAGGFLFLGHSGAGKSTTTRLWQSLRNPEILSDDRLILRIEDGELWMYGTPWHGEGCFASPGKARLEKLFVLQHGGRNRITRMSHAAAAGELFARTFPPFHNPLGLQNVIEFLDRVVNTVPVYEFAFVPDAHAVQAVLEMEHANARH